MKKIAILLSFALVIAGLSAGLLWDEAVSIRQGVNIEWFRTGTETSDGGAIYVWSDTKLGGRDIWAQKVDATGTFAWGEPRLIDSKVDRQEDPVITRTSDNNYIIAWIDFSSDLDGDVYAQKINSAGQLLWAAGGKPVCTLTGMQIALNMEADSDGGAFIVWSDSRHPSKDLYGQRISATGDPVWTVDGIAIASDTGDEIQNTMLPDGQGGMIIAYTHTYVGADDIFAKRFNSAGTMVWPNTLVLSNAPGAQNGVRMAALTGGDFVFTWEDQRNPDPDIYAQKINLAGQPQWGDFLIVYSDQDQPLPATQKNPRIVRTSDNGAIIIWEDKRVDPQNPDLFAQKISAAGTKLWNPAGIALCVAEFAQIGQRMAPDNSGGCYVVWDDLRNGNDPYDDIYAQHLSATGEALWQANGKPISLADNAQNGGLIKVSGDHIYINWMDVRNGSVGIYYQALDTAGNMLLETNGKLVFWGLSGDTPLDNYLIRKRSNDVAVIWQDTRFANDGYRIYYQILNPDGTIDFEVNGRPITDAVGDKQLAPHAVVTPDDYLAIAWEDARGANPKVYAQLLSPTGERLWGNTGLEMTDMSPIRQKDARISYYNGSYYVAWSNSDQVGSDFFYHVYAQRIQNGQKMWGPNGIMISELPTGAQNKECILYDLYDNYLVWHKSDPSDYSQTIWVKRVNEAGTAMAGWPNEGLKVSTYSEEPTQMLPKAHLTPEGIFVMWKDMREDWVLNFWGQQISPNGVRLWDPQGVNLADNGREQEYPTITHSNSGITFAWCESINGVPDIFAQKFSYGGNPLWSNLGYAVVQKDSTQSKPSIVSFANGGSIVAWADYFGIESDIYYKYIRENGEMVSDNSAGNILSSATKQQYDPVGVAFGNEAYYIWADGRTGGKTEILGLFAQKLSNEVPSALSDENAPALGSFALKQNHPNPFNPSTTISFALAKNSPAWELKIFNLKGQLVKTLFSGNLEKGNHSLIWDGKDNNGSSVGSGVYFYRLSDGTDSQQRKMLLMK
ncbi:MAG: FlgD immunoglobulin-like domain containing protein [Candidatus Cloacimonas sp.]|jgi:hypothetical protein|nr:FlgD immunoglobulin-like domain containing protein [Candidatus Cloacimonas sp.]